MSISKTLLVGLTIILSISTMIFAITTFNRISMDYNENGVYFDGSVTYNSQAIIVYGLITIILLIFTIGLITKLKKSPAANTRYSQ